MLLEREEHMHKHTLSSTLLWGWQFYVGLPAEGSSWSKQIGRSRSVLLLFFVQVGVCLFGDIREVELAKEVVGRDRGKSWGRKRGEVLVEGYHIDDEHCLCIPSFFLSIHLDVLENTYGIRTHLTLKSINNVA